MGVDATAKKTERRSTLREMVKTDNELNGKDTAKVDKGKTDAKTKYQRPNYLLRLL